MTISSDLLVLTYCSISEGLNKFQSLLYVVYLRDFGSSFAFFEQKGEGADLDEEGESEAYTRHKNTFFAGKSVEQAATSD